MAFTGVEAFSVMLHFMGLSSASPQSYPVTAAVVLITSTPGACTRVAAKTIKATTTDVEITVSHHAADPITTGTYSIGFPSSGDQTATASVTAIRVDGSCQVSSQPRQANSGTVTLSRISASEVSGSVDVTLDDGTTLVGTFGAPHCTAAETSAAIEDLPWACVQ